MSLLPLICRIVAVALALNAAPSAFAIVNGTAPATDDRRWDAVCGAVNLISGGECLEGPPTSEHATSGSGVLIMPDKVVTARHVLPQPTCGTTSACMWFKFRRLSNGTVGDFYARVASWEIATCGCPDPLIICGLSQDLCDVAIATLETPISHIKPIRVDLDPDLSDTDDCAPEPSAETYVALAGWGRGGATNPTTGLCDINNVRILRRTPIASVKTGVTPSFLSSIPIASNPGAACPSQSNCPSSGFVASQCSGAEGDSGGAIVFEDPTTCELRMIALLTGGCGNPLLGAHDDLPNGLSIPVYAGCPADLNYDGQVGGLDVAILNAAWGACATSCVSPSTFCEADLNHSGTVNGTDMGILIANWGACP